MFGMFGNECVATTWDGERELLDQLNEFGGFLTPQEACDWARKELLDYTAWDRYEKIEVYSRNETTSQLEVHTTLKSEELRPDIDFSDRKGKSQ